MCWWDAAKVGPSSAKTGPRLAGIWPELGQRPGISADLGIPTVVWPSSSNFGTLAQLRPNLGEFGPNWHNAGHVFCQIGPNLSDVARYLCVEPEIFERLWRPQTQLEPLRLHIIVPIRRGVQPDLAQSANFELTFVQFWCGVYQIWPCFHQFRCGFGRIRATSAKPNVCSTEFGARSIKCGLLKAQPWSTKSWDRSGRNCVGLGQIVFANFRTSRWLRHKLGRLRPDPGRSRPHPRWLPPLRGHLSTKFGTARGRCPTTTAQKAELAEPNGVLGNKQREATMMQEKSRRL